MELIEYNDFVFEDDINEHNSLELTESAFCLMEDYLTENPMSFSDPDFLEVMFDEVRDIFYIQFESENISIDELDAVLEQAFDVFCIHKNIERNPESNAVFDENNQLIADKINLIRAKPQPAQRTPEWYEFRHTLISASSANKAFGTEASVNQLIYEKCQPLRVADDASSPRPVNVDSSLHWGQKYEPLSVMLYEFLYTTKVDDFGCIRHDDYSFIGASPDGINVDPDSDRYGRMLEIKNVVSREITGIPKKEYYIQMQLQMEVCDLDECDFLETQFVEYENEDQYKADIVSRKGIIIHYHLVNEQKPFYVYKPISNDDVDDEQWAYEINEKYLEDANVIWIRNCYWRLAKMSCILVPRNRQWFADNIAQLETVWRIIEKERVTGYAHRAPKKREKKTDDVGGGCLLLVKKLT